MGKNSFSFRRSIPRRRHKKTLIDDPAPPLFEATMAASGSSSPFPSLNNNNGGGGVNGAAASMVVSKGKKKTVGASRLWMRFDHSGQSELVEYDKNTIIRRASIPARDLRILGPLFSHSSNILGILSIVLRHQFKFRNLLLGCCSICVILYISGLS